MNIKFCPKCKSEKVIFFAGTKGKPIGYHCNTCDYEGSIFPEKKLIKDKMKRL